MTTQPDTESGRGTGSLLRDRNLLAIISITVIAVMGVASITPALPAVAREFGIGPRQVGWLIAVFTIPGVVLTPVTGLLADRFGRKPVLIPSLALFAIAGASCALVGDFNDLLVLRGLQGVGAASLSAINITLIGDLYTGHKRATAMGYNAVIISGGAALYPLMGGLLTVQGWQFPFLLPLLALPGAAFIWFGLRTVRPQSGGPLRMYFTRLLMCLGDRRVAAMLAASLICFLLLYGPVITYLPFLLEEGFQATSVAIGLVIAASALGSMLATGFLGRMMRGGRRRAVVIAAFTLMSAPLALVPLAWGITPVALLVAVFGASHGVGLSAIQVLLTDAAPAAQRGAVMAVNGMMFRLGQTIGPILMGLLLAVWGMTGVFVGGAVIGALAVALLALSGTGKARGD